MPTDLDAIDPADLNAVVNEVKGRVAALIMKSLDEADDILDNGTSAAKLAVMKSVVPTLVRSLATVNEDNDLEKMKADMEQVRREVMQAGVISTTATTTDADADAGDADDDLRPHPGPMPVPPSPTPT